jgi:hypothetical protein
MPVKLTRYAKYLIHKRFYPRQVQIMQGHVRNPNAAVYSMVRGG